MYLPSNTPILADQQVAAAKELACSDKRIQSMRRTSARGRAQVFNTLVSPDSVTQSMGTGTSLDVARMQQQTETSRATGLLGTSTGTPSTATTSELQEMIRNAPQVVSLNRGGGCQNPNQSVQYPIAPNPTPSMPLRAPQIVNTPQGPLHFEQTDTPQWTYPVSTKLAGLTGYAPPWSDAWVIDSGQISPANDVGVAGWIQSNPWLALGIAAAGVFALTRRSR